VRIVLLLYSVLCRIFTGVPRYDTSIIIIVVVVAYCAIIFTCAQKLTEGPNLIWHLKQKTKK